MGYGIDGMRNIQELQAISWIICVSNTHHTFS
jgi:hypothetical protein